MKFKTILAILSLASTVYSRSRVDGDFCSSNPDCLSSCCDKKKCAIGNNCLAITNFNLYVDANYCDLHVKCESKCCLFGECMDYDECFYRFDRPILFGIAGGIATAFLVMFLAYFLTPFVKAIPPPPPPEEIFVDDL
jgi:hypothetical protein